MSSNDVDYLANYKPNTLYINPAREGAYTTLLTEGEQLIAEIEVTTRSRLAISLFYIKERRDFGSLKITKIKYHKTYGWREDGCVSINQFEVSHLRDFAAVLSSIELGEANKAKISLNNISIDTLSALSGTSVGKDLVKQLAQTPHLREDIYAVGKKKEALVAFKANLESDLSEGEWQKFFEANPWIFGHGLNYIFLDKTSRKLETVTTGQEHGRFGKRTDALMRTRAEISQYVLIEIKKSSTDLLSRKTYRSGCWAVSDELSGAVAQVQKTAFDFARGRFRERQKDADGYDLNIDVYCIEPKTYLVIGNQNQIIGNDDQIACFELFRRNIRSPEIITFDELYQRAECIVETVSEAVDSAISAAPTRAREPLAPARAREPLSVDEARPVTPASVHSGPYDLDDDDDDLIF